MPESSYPRTAGETCPSADSLPPNEPGASSTNASAEPVPLVDSSRFIISTRETGYRSTATALAELVDNALQANAGRIDVLIVPSEAAEPGLRLAVRDDGVGIRPEYLPSALQFGGSHRFGDRSGPGRFGMGLPNSSLSQARRVDVYSWVQPGETYHTHLDLDMAISAGASGIPPARPARLPRWASCRSPHGTVVIWSRCDRVASRRPNALVSLLTQEFGRIYRYALWSGVRMTVAGSRVRPRDPLFVRPPRGVPRAQPLGTGLRYEVRVPGSEATSFVSVRFSELPIVAWQQRTVDERRRAGVIGGGGVSVVRAGREIDYGWHLMGGKRRENYDDWWRCEIAFDPALDEHFGVTHSKQGIRPTTQLMDLLSPDLESIARTLNRRVRDVFQTNAAARVRQAERAASTRDVLLPPPRRLDEGLTPVRQYRVRTRELSSGDFFQIERRAGVRTLVLNRLHPFYTRLYGPLECEEQARFAVECLLLAAVRALETVPGESAGMRRIRADWSDALAAFLG